MFSDFDVTVYDALSALVMQVRQASGHADRDAKPLAPAQDLPGAQAGLEQVRVQRAIGHVVVHERPFAPLGAEAAEPDEVDVVDRAEGEHLGTELLLALALMPPIELLDGHGRRVRERAPEDGAESPAPELLREMPRRLLHGAVVKHQKRAGLHRHHLARAPPPPPQNHHHRDDDHCKTCQQYDSSSRCSPAMDKR
jgi:hypothetical protein